METLSRGRRSQSHSVGGARQTSGLLRIGFRPERGQIRGERLDTREKRLGGCAVCEGVSIDSGCRLVHTFELGLHTQFVGEIVDVKAEESVMGKGQMADIRKVQAAVIRTRRASYMGWAISLAKRSPSAKRVEALGKTACCHP